MIPRTTHPNRPFVQPVKQKRYPDLKGKRVTVCIAAKCQDQGRPRIVLCSDTRVSAGDYGSTDSTVKFKGISKGWIGLISGNREDAEEILQMIAERFSRTDLVSASVVVSVVTEVLAEFSSSSLCTPNCCDLLVCGFVKQMPVIMTVLADDEGGFACPNRRKLLFGRFWGNNCDRDFELP